LQAPLGGRSRASLVCQRSIISAPCRANNLQGDHVCSNGAGECALRINLQVSKLCIQHTAQPAWQTCDGLHWIHFDAIQSHNLVCTNGACEMLHYSVTVPWDGCTHCSPNSCASSCLLIGPGCSRMLLHHALRLLPYSTSSVPTGRTTVHFMQNKRSC